MKRRQKGQKHKNLDRPFKDKMIREPEKKKVIWELLSEREINIHSKERI